MATVYTHISSNKIKSLLIISIFILFIVLIAFVFSRAVGGGLSLVGLALIFAGIMSFSSYYFSDKVVLTMSGAKPVKKSDNPELLRIIENLSIGSGLPTPRVYIIDDTAPNAFATGRDPKHAVVVFTKGILQKLDKSELEGVAAHELSHVGNYDIRVMSIVVVLVGLVTLLADFFLRSLWYGSGDRRENSGQAIFILVGVALALLSPIFASLIQLAVSRKREYLADASAVLLTRYPEALAKALEKISKDKEPLEVANNATAHLYIANPFKNKKKHAWFSNLFNTHPPIEERIKLLRSM